MIFGKSKLELKVGIFVFIGLVILAIFVLSIGKVKTWTSGYHVNFIFNFVNGVKVGAPVRFAGMDAGEVRKIRYFFSPEESRVKIILDSWVKKDIIIPQDSTVWVNTLGLLGEKYVEIIPGNNYQAILAPDQTLVGVDPMPMNEVFRLAKGMVDNLNEIVVKINEGQGTIGKFMNDDAVYNNLEAFTDDIKRHPWKLFIKGREKKVEKDGAEEKNKAGEKKNDSTRQQPLP